VSISLNSPHFPLSILLLWDVLLWTNTHRRTLCKGLVVSLCNNTSEVSCCAYFCTAWLGSKFFGTFTWLVVKVYNLCRV
jgi:hypothetical protein